MQRCAECGCRTPWGESLQHFIGCEHTSSHGKGQAQSLTDFLSGKIERAGVSRADLDQTYERFKRIFGDQPAGQNLLNVGTDPKLLKHLSVNLH